MDRVCSFDGFCLMTNIKYVLAPGPVVSQHDGQEHYISAMQLLDLYGLRLSECRVYDPKPDWTPSMYRYEEQQNRGLIWLRPRPDGDYSLESLEQRHRSSNRGQVINRTK